MTPNLLHQLVHPRWLLGTPVTCSLALSSVGAVSVSQLSLMAAEPRELSEPLSA